MKRTRVWLACIVCGLFLSLAGCAKSASSPSLPSGTSSWEKIGEISENGYTTYIHRVKAADGVEYIVIRCGSGVSVIPAPARKVAEPK